ncbi:MAG: hypothetical protein HYX76_10440 [Acidobacteria bacterium]|nr:hypothetical protein [Acidobacteriota bacterium]
MLVAISSAFLVGYLPGALLFRIPFANRERREALDAEERVFWGVIISIGWSCAITLALAAAGRYSFRSLLVVNLLLSLAILAIGNRRLRFGRGAPRPGPSTLIPLTLVALGAWAFFPPSEYVIGGKDPGVYVNEGVQIAQRGSLELHDPVIAAVPPQTRNLFFPWHRDPNYFGIRFMGFFVMDPTEGTVLGQFPHLYPASMAIGYGLDGLTGVRRTSGVWALVGLLAVYFAGARLVGRTAAGLATALLSINVVDVWYARYPNAEIVMQALLFAALLANARSQIDGDRFFAPVAGSLLGLLLFLRYDALLAIACMAAGSGLGLLDRKPIRAGLVLSLAFWLLLAWVYLTRLMRPYADLPLTMTRQLGLVWLILGALVALVVLWRAARSEPLASRLREWIPIGLGAIVAAAAFYAYFLRQPVDHVALHDAMSLRSFTWYSTRLALVLGVAGFGLVAIRRFWRDPALLLTLAGFALFTFYKLRIVPDHFWMTRRFVAVILPGTLLCASALCMSPLAFWQAFAWPPRLQLRSRRAALVAVGALLAALTGWRYLQASYPVRHHVEYAGIIPKLEALAARFGDDDLVLVETRNSSDLHVLATPLAYIYARNVLVFAGPRPNKGVLGEFLDWAEQNYRNVYFIGGGGMDLLSRSIGIEALDSDRFQVPEYESPRNAYPREVRRKEFDFGIYRFVPPGPQPPWVSLDVGVMDDLQVLRFHAKEHTGSTTFRWTRDSSFVNVLGVRQDSRIAVFWMGDGGRPSNVEPARVTVQLNDQQIGEVTIERGGGFRPYTFSLPPALAAAAAASENPAVFRLLTNTWSPRATLGRGDDRQLGVMLDRVEVR